MSLYMVILPIVWKMGKLNGKERKGKSSRVGGGSIAVVANGHPQGL